MKQLYFLLFLLLFGIKTLTGQIQDTDRAIIYCYDGSVFIGKIIAEDDLQLTLRVVTSDMITIQKGLIKTLFRNSEDVLIFQGGKLHYTSGLFFSSTMGFGINPLPSFDWDFIFGRRLNKKYSVGLGASLNFNSAEFGQWNWVDNHFIPVFAYGRYYLTEKRKARFFVSTRLGYGFPSNELFWSDAHSGGIHFQPGVGVHFASRKAGRFIMTLSQMVQNTKGDQFSQDFLGNPVFTRYNYWYNRTMLKIGIEFH